MSALLELRKVTKNYALHGQWIPACVDVSLTVNEGEFVALVGPSGCGKSTLLEVVSGLAQPDRGEVLLQGEDIVGRTGRVSYMPQDDLLFPWRKVVDNVALPLQIAHVPKAERTRRALELLEAFGLGRYAHALPAQLSGGMRQRAAFLRTVLQGKTPWLLDEPFGRLDAMTRRRMQNWLLGLWSRFHYSVLLVTHDIEEAILLSDRVYVMSSAPGRIVAELPVALPRPRGPELRTSIEFIELKSRLTEYLESKSAYEKTALTE